MFAMGVTVNYSRKNSPGALVRRGLSLYVLGFVDSIFCYLLGVVFPWTLIYLFGAALIVLSAWLAERWANRKRTVGTA